MRAEERDSALRTLCRAGGASALVAAAFAFLQVFIEIVGVGVLAVPVPATVDEWFRLLQSNTLLGLTELTALQIPVFILLVPALIALSAALLRTNVASVVTAFALALLGIAVYLASNTALSMLSLSKLYAAAATDVDKSMILAAGRAMLAVYEGVGVNVGLFLVMVGVLMLSGIMLRGSTFSRVTAYMGMLAGAATMLYYIVSAFSSLAIFILEVAGLLTVIWLILVGRRLYRLGSGQDVAANLFSR